MYVSVPSDYENIHPAEDLLHKEGRKKNMRSVKKTSLLLLFLALNVTILFAQEKKLREPDVVFVPTPQEVVDQMMKLANVHAGDVLYDLGCGDGRIVIAAASAHQATAEPRRTGMGDGARGSNCLRKRSRSASSSCS